MTKRSLSMILTIYIVLYFRTDRNATEHCAECVCIAAINANVYYERRPAKECRRSGTKHLRREPLAIDVRELLRKGGDHVNLFASNGYRRKKPRSN